MASAAALAFVGKSVATPAISFLVNKAFTYLNEYRKAEGMDELKRRIELAVPKIQSVFDVVNPGRIKEGSNALDVWLWQLRDAIEQAEDAVDEVEYYELEEKAKDRIVSDWGSSFAKMKHEAVKSIEQSRIVGKAIKSLTHHGTLKRLREAVEGLDKAAAGVVDFLHLADHLKENTGRREEGMDRETGSILTAPQLFGRDEEKDSVIGWLTTTSCEHSEIVVSSNYLSLVSIVGHGGMGKTTLAQLICQDDIVKKHFELVIWACVSTSFDAKTVTSKILESARCSTPDANTLDALQKILKEKLMNTKFLLVLDDVWDDQNNNQWEILFAPLRAGKSGSKILLTTRMKSVVDLADKALGGQNMHLPLQGLKEDENINLFNYHAFPSARFQDYPNLQSTGEQIAKKVGGCPLVTKVVASYLRDNLTYQYWKDFLDQRLQDFKGSADDIKNVLRLSYFHLAPELQACFRYCSIFPQDYEFDKDKLVEMWVSSGLISLMADRSQSDLLEIGEWYLFQLTRKSFFELKFRPKYIDGVIEDSGYYVMHDLMHDLAESVSLGECARIVDVACLVKVKPTVRHMLVEDIHILPVEKINEITCSEKLRSIIINESKKEVNKDILNTVEELVESSKSLRLFETNLRHTSAFAGKLGKLKHLRFVKLKQISAESIKEIVKLYHLRTLYTFADVKIEPKQLRDIGNLDRLQNVTYGSTGWGKFPVGRLNSLLVLHKYEIRGVKGYKISALKDLRILRRLDLTGLESVRDQEEAKEAKLKEKQHMKSLYLEWSECNDARSMSDELILDNLEPHANLMKLKISGFCGRRMPHWIAKPSLRNLEMLELNNCRNCEKLPILGILTLKHLKLQDLSRLKFFVSKDEYTELFLQQNLCTLEVLNCPELAKLPRLPPTLVSLRIVKVGLTKLPSIGERHNGDAETALAQLREIWVENCGSITSLEGSLFEQRQYMGAVYDLRISNCEQLESAHLPFEEMNELSEFRIEGCPKLRTRRGAEDNKLLPSSSQMITIGQCGDMELTLLGSLQQLTNLCSLHLHDCTTMESLPSADVFRSLKWMGSMMLIGCGNLSSLGGLGSLRSLGQLIIIKCRKLAEAGPSVPRDVSGGDPVELEISSIIIDLPSLLLVEPLNSQRNIEDLTISGGSEMKSLPEPWLLQNRSSLKSLRIWRAKSLESLRQSMRDLSSLETLNLHGAGQLRSLLDLPSSLQRLEIWECNSELENELRNMISKIRCLQIGDSYFIMGKKCSNEDTFEELSQADDSTLSSWLSQQEEDNGKGVESASNTWNKLCYLAKDRLPSSPISVKMQWRELENT